MSHFIGLCFGIDWEYNLDYYDESKQVESYIAYTKEDAINEVKQMRAKTYEHALEMLNESDISEQNREYYNKIIDKGLFISYEDAWEEAKNWGYELDENENLMSTYNPNSRWDWYCIGGRWSNYIYLKELDSEGNHLTTNQATFGEIDWEYMLEQNKVPFCFVTSEGDWYEKGEMGWWGIITNEKDSTSWKDQFKEHLKYVEDDCLVTAVDFHI